MDSQKQNGALLIAASIVAAIRLRGGTDSANPKSHGYDCGFGAVGKDGAGEA